MAWWAYLQTVLQLTLIAALLLHPPQPRVWLQGNPLTPLSDNILGGALGTDVLNTGGLSALFPLHALHC